MDKANFKENLTVLQGQTLCRRTQNEKGEVSWTFYSMNKDINDAFTSLIEKNRELKSVDEPLAETDEYIKFDVLLFGRTYTVKMFCNGEMHFLNGKFNIGKDAYNEFFALLESQKSKTDEAVVVATTSTSYGVIYKMYDYPEETTNAQTTALSDTGEMISPAYNPDDALMQSETLGDFLDKTGFVNDLSTGWSMGFKDIYYTKGDETVQYQTHVDGITWIKSFIESQRDVKAQIRQNTSEEKISFMFTIASRESEVYFTSDGFMYIVYANNTCERAFEIGPKAYKEFLKGFETNTAVYDMQTGITLG